MYQCEFCNQFVMDDATGCDCPMAKQERAIEEQITSANARVVQLFVNQAEEYGFENITEDALIDLMRQSVELLARGTAFSVTINFGSGTAKLGVNSSGKISVERKRTQKYKLEE